MLINYSIDLPTREDTNAMEVEMAKQEEMIRKQD